MEPGLIVAPAAIAIIMLGSLGLNWWMSNSKSYRTWLIKDAQRTKEELETRPKPPWADDPIAKSIEWTGTSEFGADPSPNPKGATVRIRSVSGSRIEFQPTSARPWHMWMLFFSAVGFALALMSSASFGFALLFPLFFMSISAAVWLARYLTRESLVFDKQLGVYWRGKDTAAPPTGPKSSERSGRISDIHALQLISTRRFVGDPRMGADSELKEFPTYELNLVLKDGARLSTVCLDDYGSIDHDAEILAAFLHTPLWKPRSGPTS